LNRPRFAARKAGSHELDLSARIGEWASTFEPSPSRLARVRASIRDFLGCVVAGTRQPELRHALWLAHGGGVPVWGLADSFDGAGAALITATAGSLLQLHDYYSPGASHPSAPVISAAWAARHADGRTRADDFARAVAAGYETANRIADACMPAQLLAGSSPTGTAGSIGAAVAAALIRDLGAAGIARAVANAAMMLPATPFAAMRSHGALVPLHTGLAARAGYEAASLAREAGAGQHVLEGDARGCGLIELLAGTSSAVEPERWHGETLDAVGWKFFPACLATHAAIEAVLRLERIAAADIARVTIRRPGGLLESLVALGPTDGDLYDRLMSLRWVVARALELGRYAYPDAVVHRPATMDLAHKIELVVEAPVDASEAAAQCIHVEVHAADGRTHSIDYVRSAVHDPEQRGPRGFTRVLDELALRRKYDELIAGTRLPAHQLLCLGIG
jgi:2-methylcitrate dehydratase PrpD